MVNASRAAVLAAFLFALPLVAPAHEKDSIPPEDRLVDKFTRFAGSKANAESLVNGLRNDQQVTLTSAQGTTTSFTPKTDKMGFGSVNIALTLAKATLAQQGITRPTPQQIEAALNGGTVTTSSGKQVTFTGILTQRANGMGFGKIAQANGLKLGELLRHKHEDFRHHRHHAEFKHREHHRADFQKVRFERHEKFERMQRPERVERAERPERPERPERHGRG
ncbi:MAG TPA: hypothetical protein VKE95_08335 [Burkholderiales bacterium]|nr:hypothetical protein [Burkholderiales bacterium]